MANHTSVAQGTATDLKLAQQVPALAHKAQEQLLPPVRSAGRWRLLHLRALLDARRYELALRQGWPLRQSWGDLPTDDDVAQDAFEEMGCFYRSREKDAGNMGDHARVRPPLRRPLRQA